MHAPLPVFERSFVVRAPLAAVRAFHERPDAVRSLTPALLTFTHPPPPLATGERVHFTLWVGPLPVRWVARYEDVREDGFVDVQEAGPFRSWRHEHRYRALDAERTEVTDRIAVELGRPVSRAIWVGLPPSFAYRAWATRRAVEP